MPTDLADGLTTVLDAVRSGRAVTQPQLTRLGLGRAVVAQRVAELERAGLIAPDGLAPSTGGRAPKALRLRAEAGVVVAIDCAATGMVVAVADLAAQVLAETTVSIDVADGPDIVLRAVERAVDRLLRRVPDGRAVWGIAMSVPGPVEFSTARPVAPPIMPGWDGYPIRERLAGRYDAPVWVDNDVNVLALGEYRSRPADDPAADLICVKIGTGIGAGLISGGRLHRGADGCAGDIGHVAVHGAGPVLCRCGNIGCLEAAAGGAAIDRDGLALAESGRSRALAAILQEQDRLTVLDVLEAARHGDRHARSLTNRAGRLVGQTLATLVSFYNPSLIILSGNVVDGSEHLVQALGAEVRRRSLPLATRSLRIETSQLGRRAGLLGAVHLALDTIFDPACLAAWLPTGSPAGRPDIASLPLQPAA